MGTAGFANPAAMLIYAITVARFFVTIQRLNAARGTNLSQCCEIFRIILNLIVWIRIENPSPNGMMELMRLLYLILERYEGEC